MPEKSTGLENYRYCLSSPPLLDFLPHLVTQEELRQISQNIELSQLPLPGYNHRLGLWYEQLWIEIIKQYRAWELLAHNHQVIENKQTCGAIDFLVADHDSQQVIHFEIAIKFYLHFFENGWQGWLGPDPKDQLSKKVARLLNHQLPMGFHPQIQKMKARYPKYRFSQKLILQGRLFEAGTKPSDGIWMRNSQLTYQERHAFKPVERQYWLTPHLAPEAVLPETISKTTMIYGRGQQIMLTPECWPFL
ncbi:MAG: hypothetical protein CENE_03273 [Candidatus Celerinatantimonas neptuna]|nr:MAG: hypothetical protein CENE_03273 [Candidatus Celerinatantimonas neptuna]